MKKLMASSLCLVVGAELLALLLHDRRMVLWLSGIAVALGLLSIRRFLGQDVEAVAELNPDDLGDSLRRWLTTTETLIRRSESTRADWDRHLRPMLARRFEMATGQRKAKDPAAFHSTGRMLFGAELWGWVNPDNVSATGRDEPGPGRGTLEEILERMERV